MRQILILLLFIFSFFIFVRSANATTCIPSFFDGSIVVAQLNKINLACDDPSKIANQNANLQFSNKKNVFNQLNQDFEINTEFYPENDICIENEDATNANISLGLHEGSTVMEKNKLYLLKINKYDNDRLFFASCDSETILEIASQNDLIINKIFFETVGNNMLFGILLSIFSPPSYVSTILEKSSIPSSFGLILSGIFSIIYIGLWFFVIFKLFKFIFKLIFKRKNNVTR